MNNPQPPPVEPPHETTRKRLLAAINQIIGSDPYLQAVGLTLVWAVPSDALPPFIAVGKNGLSVVETTEMQRQMLSGMLTLHERQMEFHAAHDKLHGEMAAKLQQLKLKEDTNGAES